MNQKLYVNYGCGVSAPDNWINFDSSPTLLFEKIPLVGKMYTRNNQRFPKYVKYGDIVKGLPIPPESCAGIYASHILEHLALEDFRVALTNTYRLLIPGGLFRLVVPDLEYLAKTYINSENPLAAEEFVRNTWMGVMTRRRGLLGWVEAILGNSRHLWMWDFKSLRYELMAVGFMDIRRCDYSDATDVMFKQVEHPLQFVNAVGIECRKPLSPNQQVDCQRELSNESR